ncbi:MAG: ATP-binding protein [Elusimicrobiota bacterium]
MLIQFTVGNFLSFKEKVTLSMVKSALHELPENVIKIDDDFELLKSAVIYGANASGKSNLIKALAFMKLFTVSSFKLQIDEELGIYSFLLNEETKDGPSFFEIVFIIDSVTYRYGFEADKKKVKKEWLYYTPKTKEEKLFDREGSVFNISPEFLEGFALENKTRENCLFLTVVSQFNGEISAKIIKWFNKLRVITSRDYQTFLFRTLTRFEQEPNLKENIIKFISVADNGVEDFEIESINTPIDQVNKNMLGEKKDLKIKVVKFIHRVFNINKQVVGKKDLLIDYFESEGTKKMFALSVPVVDALRNSEIIVVDELENHLHPLLLKHIIKLFNSSSNKNNAQLIFTTHNLTCMSHECFRRDQIWFTEKNSFGESSLFPLADYKIEKKKIRSDATYSKDYLLGKYGAVPFIDDIDLSFKEKDNEPSK